jgi:hypothetical protein
LQWPDVVLVIVCCFSVLGLLVHSVLCLCEQLIVVFESFLIVAFVLTCNCSFLNVLFQAPCWNIFQSYRSAQFICWYYWSLFRLLCYYLDCQFYISFRVSLKFFSFNCQSFFPLTFYMEAKGMLLLHCSLCFNIFIFSVGWWRACN